jgi:hypothetical protein
VARIQEAIEFVRSHGTPVEQARLNLLIGSRDGIPEAVEELEKGQRADGGWAPFWAQDASSVDASCFRLAQCEQLGLTTNEMIRRAVAFLAIRQQQDGSLEEEPELASVAPRWAAPGDVAAHIYLTANAGYWIRHYQPSNPALPRIQKFLTSHIGPDGRVPSFLHAHWLTAGLLYGLGAKPDAQQIMDGLRARLSELEASNFAWMVNCLCITGVAPDTPLIADSLSRLDALQQDDGRWPSEHGEGQDVHTTLETLRAISFVRPLPKLGGTP